jgi:hypothetical protein
LDSVEGGINERPAMSYFIITSHLGALSQSADDVSEALLKATLMHQSGLIGIFIKNNAGRVIAGDDLLACIDGKKSLTADLTAK